MSELDDGSKSCIKTECVIPSGVILPWLLARFPELARDARLVKIEDTYRGGYKFTIEHTVQEPVLLNPPPIALTPPADEVTDG
jgi:hypothetical protein